MTAGVAWQEHELDVAEATGDQRIRRASEGGVDEVLADVGEPRELVQA